MPAYDSEQSTCRKLGLILTCYVDGRKRFRAVRLEPPTPAAANDDPAPAATRRPFPRTRVASPSPGPLN